MIGELNASHTGVKGPVRGHPATYTTKLTGFDMVPDGGYLKVSHIFWEGSADKEWVDLNVGDFVLSIDGKDIRSGDNYWSILNHCLNDYVTFEVSSDPEGDDVHQIRIKTVTSLRDIKYKEWVEKNRKYVKELTDDKIAYVHIQRMDRSSLEKFKNEISRYHNHKGIVIDIRYNGGGNIDQELLDILSRRAYQYWNQRWSSREMGRRHRHAIIGPKVILINHGSASNSEVTPLGFRDLGLGRIVGNPTAGAVISTGSYGLINGGSMRLPKGLVVRYDPTQPNNYGVNLENYGVAPDVWVENSPEDELSGFDRELKTAVDEAMKMLAEQEAEIEKIKKKKK
jgi:tricorn protease